MIQINAYLNFNGNCREAMSFYKECLGGDLILQPVKGTPMEDQCPAGKENEILHSSLTGEGFLLMASDMIGKEGYQLGNNFGLSVNCTSEEHIHSLFNKLAEGGNVFMPVREQFWGALFGALSDKFGVRWMFNYDKPKA
jgi:PhnB protein